MRFGQLGEAGICTRLDSAGVLTHRVAGIDDIEYAMDNPPLVGRACLRGRYVRELSGAGERYACDWHRLCDYKEQRLLDLRDPFTAVAQWQPVQAFDEVELLLRQSAVAAGQRR